MAEEFVSVIKIEAGDSEQTVKGLKQQISDLRDEILNLEKGTKQYDDAVDALQDSQRKLDEVMSLTKKTATALEGSYDALVHKMAQLKKEWRATNDEAKRNELGQQIAEINGQLKDFDASLGNFQRNVGNYQSALDGMENKTEDFAASMRNMQETIEPTKAKFESVQKIASGVASGFAAVQGAAALLGVENENLEKTFIKLQAAMALAQGIGGLGDLVEGLGKAKVAFKDLGNTVKAVSATMGKTGWIAVIVAVVAAITLVTSAIKKKRQEVDALDESLKKLERRNNNINTSYNERSRQLERNIKLMSAQGATEEEVIKKRMELNQIYEDAAKENYKEAQKQYLGLRDSLSMGIRGVTQEDVDKAKEIYDDANMVYQDFVEKRKDLANDLVIAQIKAKEQLKTTLPDLEVDIEVDDAELPTLKSDIKITDVNGQAEKKADYLIALAERVANRERELNEMSTLSEEEKAQKDYEINLKLQEDKLALLKRFYDEAINNGDVESFLNLQQDIADQEIEIQKVKYERLKELADEKTEADKERFAKTSLSFQDQIKEFGDAWDKMEIPDKINMIGSAIAQSFSAVGDITNALADDLEANGEDNEKNAKKIKNLRIATATMDMLSGIVGAISSAAPMGPVGWALGAIQAASIATIGGINITKIKNTDFNGNADTSSVTPSASTYATELPATFTRQITGASEIESLNQDTRVYILESDIQASNKRVQVRESESSF